MFTGFCSYNKEQKAFKNEQKEKWDGDRKKISDQKIAGRSGIISAYGDGTGVPLYGTGGAGEKRRRGLCADLQVQRTDGAGRI